MAALLARLRNRVAQGRYEVSGHAERELENDGFEIADRLCCVASGRIVARQRDVQRGHLKYVIQGTATDGRAICIVCRLMRSGDVLVITVFEEKP